MKEFSPVKDALTKACSAPSGQGTRKGQNMKNKEQTMLEEYRANIKLLVDNCKDMSLLDLLYKLLIKEGVQLGSSHK